MKIEVIDREELVNHINEAVEPIPEKVVDMVVKGMDGIKGSPEKELKGIPLMVMRAMMDYEIAKVSRDEHEHETVRQHNCWGSNLGSVALDGQRIKLEVPRVVEKETKKSYRLETYPLFHHGTELVKRAYRDLIRGISTRNYAEGVEKLIGG